MVQHHWLPDQIRNLDLEDFLWAVRATDAHNRRLRAALDGDVT